MNLVSNNSFSCELYYFFYFLHCLVVHCVPFPAVFSCPRCSLSIVFSCQVCSVFHSVQLSAVFSFNSVQLTTVFSFPKCSVVHCVQSSAVLSCPLISVFCTVQLSIVLNFPQYLVVQCVQLSTVFSCPLSSVVLDYPLGQFCWHDIILHLNAQKCYANHVLYVRMGKNYLQLKMFLLLF